MKRKVLFGGLICGALLAAGLALAQITTAPLVSTINAADAFLDISTGSLTQTTSVYASALQLRAFMLGQNSAQNAVPTLTTTTSICGGSTATVKGTGVSGQVSEGTTASTSCVVAFPVAYATAPECFVSINNVADTALKCSTTISAMTVTQTSASSNVMNYLIVGLPGG
jgi:hypothetical protein